LAERIPGATLTRLTGGDHYTHGGAARRGDGGAAETLGSAVRHFPRGGYTTRVTVKRDIAASRQQVWDVMADGWTYSQWVVGNSRMRAVDPNWPAPGSIICHSIGVWPLVLDDQTVVEKSIPLEELVLHAKGRPFGGARVILRLSDIPDGCRVEMEEYPISGPAAILPNRLSDLAAWPRNHETLWRLGALAERLKPSELD
jgi:Polyketide cyclase / dehydrase and lipid transport